MRLTLVVVAAILLLLGVVATRRFVKVRHGHDSVPVYPGAREGPAHTRYLPRVLSWDDRSSARVDRVFALPRGTTLLAVARHAADSLATHRWYLATPSDLAGPRDPQVVVWQRDPDERLDLVQLWPVDGMSRTARMYGGRFPEAFLDEPVVIGWSWALGGPRSARPLAAPTRAIVSPPPLPPAPPSRNRDARP